MNSMLERILQFPIAIFNKLRLYMDLSRATHEERYILSFCTEDFKHTLEKRGRFVSPGLAKRSQTGDEIVSIVDIKRLFILHEFCKASLVIPGDVAECGVYKGGTAFVLANVLKNREKSEDKTLHLFDSFQGLPDKILPIDSDHRPGHFGDSSVGLVKKRLEGYQHRIYPGFFENTLDQIKNSTFCFVHIDVDIYSSAKECTEFFYPRINPGGFIIYDDYGFSSTKGVKFSVDEFYRDKLESPIVLPTKQCLIIKI